jgi:hypothetical protein
MSEKQPSQLREGIRRYFDRDKNPLRVTHSRSEVKNRGEWVSGCTMMTFVAGERAQMLILEQLRQAFGNLVESCGGDVSRAAEIAGESMNRWAEDQSRFPRSPEE